MTNKASPSTAYYRHEQWERVLQSIPASYTVWNDDGTYRAESNFKDGISHPDYSGTDAATTTQNALDALTGSRTWKEKVTLKGTFTIDATLQIPAYTIFELQGKITLANGVNDAMVNVGTGAALLTDVDLIGGIYDGNKTNQTNGHGIRLYANGSGSIRCLVDGIHVTNAYGSGLSCDSFTDTIVNNSRFTGNGSFGLYFENVGGCIANNCIARTNKSGFGIYAADTTQFINCHARVNTENGFSIQSGTGITITGGSSRDNTLRGVAMTEPVGVNTYITVNNLFDYNNGVTSHKTENTGASTGTGIEQTIAHGLYATPKNVTIVPNVTGATYSVWADATNIYPTVTNLKTYNWFASVS